MPPFFLDSISLLNSLPSVQGDCSQLTTCCFCCYFLLTFLPCCSVKSLPQRQSSTNFSNMSPSDMLQFFMNCSNVGTLHRMQPFRNRLLQCESPTGSQILPANLLSLPKGLQVPTISLFQHGIPKGSWPPSGTSACSKVASSTGCRCICMLHTPVDLHAGAQLLHHGLHQELQGNLFQCLEHLLSLLPH